MRSHALLLLMALLLAAGAALLWPWRGAAPPEAGGSVADPEPAGQGVAAATHGAAEHRPASQPDSLGRERVVAATPDVPQGPVSRVAVLDRETGLPVADAEVGWLETDPTAQTQPEAPQQDQEPVVRRAGRVFRSDASGLVSVPRCVWAAVVTARKGDLYGEGLIGPRTEEPFQLLLERDLTLRVRVRDAAGSAQVGVPIRLRAAGTQEGEAWQWQGIFTTAAPDGVVTVSHLQRWTRPKGKRASGTFEAYVHLPGMRASTPEFDAHAPPREPLDLVLSEFGSLLVEATDAAGDPCRGGGWVTVSDGGTVRRWGMALDPGTGRARFPRVATGARLQVQATIGEARTETKEVAHPRRAGAEVAVQLQLPATQPVLVGRAVDAEGAPLAGRQLTLLLATERNGTDHLRATSDGDGRFRLFPHASKANAALSRLLFVLGDGPEGFFAKGALPRTLAPGIQDLGDLVFREAPLLVGGTVLDPVGQPVPDARLVLRLRGNDGRGAPQDLELGLWSADVATRRFEDGRFEFRGDVGMGTLTLLAGHPDAPVLPPITFPRGQSDLRVVLTNGGGMRATLLLDAGFPAEDLEVRLAAPAASDVREAMREDTGWGEGRLSYAWRGLRPGTYELTVQHRLERAVVRAVPGLVVEAGQACADPRLAPLDLRGAARKIVLTAADGSGQPLQLDGRVLVRDGGSVALIGGRATLWITRPAVDVVVSAGTKKRKPFTGITADAQLRLEDGYPVRIEVGGLAAPAEARLFLSLADRGRRPGESAQEAMLRAYGDSVRMHDGSLTGKRDADSAAWVFAVPEPGSYAVALQVRGPSGWGDVPGVEPARVTVGDVEEEQRFAVAVTAQALADALRRPMKVKR